MCNLYDIGPERRESGRLEQLLASVLESLPKLFGIRKTDTGAIIRMDEGSLEPTSARWGFHRPFNPSVNNARSDKLTSGMWSKAWQEKRRCLIPASSFYEWTGPKGNKQTNAIQIPNDRMWMAGLWEDNPDIGLSFTTLTTSANDAMTPIHNRMPVILAPQTTEAFLTADDPMDLVRPYDGELKIFRCENPLVKGAKEGPPKQAH